MVIIEPYWNWKKEEWYPNDVKRLVIIEPYWNWKLPFVSQYWWVWIVIIEPYWNWKKYNTLSAILASCYNWTLLELKDKSLNNITHIIYVIIEPYWNWKKLSLAITSFIPNVIIEPYWNWKTRFHSHNLEKQSL